MILVLQIFAVLLLVLVGIVLLAVGRELVDWWREGV